MDTLVTVAVLIKAWVGVVSERQLQADDKAVDGVETARGSMSAARLCFAGEAGETILQLEAVMVLRFVSLAGTVLRVYFECLRCSVHGCARSSHGYRLSSDSLC